MRAFNCFTVLLFYKPDCNSQDLNFGLETYLDPTFKVLVLKAQNPCLGLRNISFQYQTETM